MKCDKQLAVAKEHKSVDQKAFRVDCGESGHYLGPGRYLDPASINELASWPPATIQAPASIRAQPLYRQIR